MRPELVAEGLTKAAGGVDLLRGIDFHWRGGTVVGLTGPNGAGKTTLLNVISGFVTPDSGRCRLGPTVLTGMPPFRIAAAGISRSFQSTRLVLSLSALQQTALAVAAAPAGAPRRLRKMCMRTPLLAGANRLLDRVGFSAHRHEPLAIAALGHLKQVALACCLAADAAVLLLDEPLAGMDAPARAAAVALFRDLRAEGRLVVLIEHDERIVRDVADTLAGMDDGRIVFERQLADER